MDLLKAVWGRFSERRGSTLAAAIGYRAIFALAPLLVVVVSVAGVLFGERATRGLLATDLVELLGSTLARAIEDLLATATGQGQVGIVGGLLLLWAGSGLFNELQGAMLSIFGLSPKAGISSAVRRRLVTLAAVILLALGFAILVAMAAWIPLSGSVVASLGTTGFVFVAVLIGFRHMTFHRPRWRLAAAIAAVTVLAMGAASFAVGVFVSRGGGGSAAGIAGSATAVLLLIYVLCLIYLSGAAFLRELEVRQGPSVQTTDAL